MKCVKCNMNIGDKTKFCTHCGAVNPIYDTNQGVNSTSVCINCNMEVRNDFKFCGKCGTPNPNYDGSQNLSINANSTSSAPIERPKTSFFRVIGVILICFVGLAVLSFVAMLIVLGPCILILSGL